MNFNESPEFQKDVKRLAKKWRSIPSDIEAAKVYIKPLYENLSDDVNVQVYRDEFFSGKRAAILRSKDDTEVIKMRLDVADLGRNDKVPLLFTAVKSNGTITFIELYAKNEKARENTQRIKKYMP